MKNELPPGAAFTMDGVLYDEQGVAIPPPAADPDTLSATIAQLPPDQRPNAPCCSICPAAYWQSLFNVAPRPGGDTRPNLKCRCTAFHEVTYDDANPQAAVITQCDGLERALKKKYDTPALEIEDVQEMIAAALLAHLNKPAAVAAAEDGGRPAADAPPGPELNR